MKSAVFSRGTTLQLPNTQRMLYPPHYATQCFSVCVCECLSPHHRGILRGRARARRLISSEDTLLLLFFLSSLCCSAPPLLASYECVLFTFILSPRWWTLLPLMLLPSHYTLYQQRLQGSTLDAQGGPEKGSSWQGMLCADQGCWIPGWMVVVLLPDAVAALLNSPIAFI